jgi:alanine-synthesizing transaminase
MNTPIQQALPVWLGARAGIQKQILDRVRGNLAELDRALAEQTRCDEGGGVLVNRLRAEGGWYAVLRIPAIQPDEVTARELLELGVWMHPGYFFGMGESGWLVVSLLSEREEFDKGISILLEYLRKSDRSHP